MSSSKRTTLFLATIFIQLIGVFSYFVWAGNATLVGLFYLSTKILMVLAPVMLLSAGLALPRFTLRPNFRKSLWLGVGSGMLIALLMGLVFFFFQKELASFSPIITTKIDALGIASYYIPFAIFVSFLHSLFEEYYWRWYVVRGLQTVLSSTQAILLGNAGFTLHHYILLSQFFPWHLTLLFGTCVGIGGVLWSMMYRKTESLLAPWLSHVFADLSIFLIGYLLMK